MIYAGIDYSLTSPSLCSFNSEDGDFLFENCDFSVLSDKKVPKGIAKNIFIYPHKPWKTSDERYHNIADHFMQMDMLKFKDKILIEDYSMGSKGRCSILQRTPKSYSIIFIWQEKNITKSHQLL